MSDLKSKFLQVYSILKSELLQDPAFEYTDDSRLWIDRMLDYNVPRGKLDRGLSVVYCYKSLMEGKELSENEIFLTSVLGWCIEWLQAFALIIDDIMDNSHTRRGQPCWFRVPKVGMIAVNDGLILRNQVGRILKTYFRDKPFYEELLDMFNEVEFQSLCGEMLDLICTHQGEKDLSKYSIPLYFRIAEYKGAYYSIYLPFVLAKEVLSQSFQTRLQRLYPEHLTVACALLMAGENLDDHLEMKKILIEMAAYFQVQDDYLDCFGDPEVTGKIGTDIEDCKCSWLVVKALELANEEQKQLLNENYGKEDPACVAKVKELYRALDLESVYEEYEMKSYEKLINSVANHPSKAVKVVWGKYIASRGRVMKS